MKCDAVGKVCRKLGISEQTLLHAGNMWDLVLWKCDGSMNSNKNMQA